MTPAPTTPEVSHRVWTIPNIISMVRIALIVVFAVCLIGESDGWALAALAVAGVSDFFDGYLARRLNQATYLGRILDPAADRLLTLVIVVGLPLRGIIPWWLAGLLIARDLVVGVALLIARRRGIPPPHVTYSGKAATFGLYFFLPVAFFAFERWDALWLTAMVGAVVAAVAYWISGVGYVAEVRRGTRDVAWREADTPRGGES